MRAFERAATAIAVSLACILLAACNTTSGGGLSSWGNTLATVDVPTEVAAVPDDQVVQAAKSQYAAGNYGHAAKYYERAVELTPQNGEAWLGLAASYDRIRRFDLADRAYREAGRYLGDRAEYYNNVGYSYLLRGDAQKARDNFLMARRLDPSNVTVNNNLELLRSNANNPPPG